MTGNILLRLSEAARRAVLKCHGDPEHQFAIKKNLSLVLWILGEWQDSLDAKVKASTALEEIWDTVVTHIDNLLRETDAEVVNLLFDDMSRLVKRKR